MQPELKIKELENKVVIRDNCIKNLLGIFFKSSFFFFFFFNILSFLALFLKEKLHYPKQKSTEGGVWLQEM